MNEELWSRKAVELINERMQSGQLFLGAVDGSGALELVFTMGSQHEFNLITVEADGQVLVGFVASPERYVS